MHFTEKNFSTPGRAPDSRVGFSGFTPLLRQTSPPQHELVLPPPDPSRAVHAGLGKHSQPHPRCAWEVQPLPCPLLAAVLALLRAETAGRSFRFEIPEPRRTRRRDGQARGRPARVGRARFRLHGTRRRDLARAARQSCAAHVPRRARRGPGQPHGLQQSRRGSNGCEAPRVARLRPLAETPRRHQPRQIENHA